MTTIPIERTRPTEDGGMAVLLTNKTGAASVQGYLVTASPTTDMAVALAGVDAANCIGVFLHSGVADGAEAWVVCSGIAKVFFSASATRGHMARIGVDADIGEGNGKAVSEAYPSAPFATDKHFAEVGHVLESRTGAGLARCVLHFN